MNQPLLDFKNITKIYPGVCALDNVDFSLTKGEVHCLVGENGSGKSTMIKIISGVTDPEPGAKRMFAARALESFSALDAIRMGVRVIYQDLALFPNLTVKENISFGIYNENSNPAVNWKTVESRAVQAMDLIGLNLDPDRKVSTLSIAEQQQVEIARSLTGDLKLLILDEPTASLTRSEVDRLFATIRTLKERRISTLFVSHKLNEVFEIAERVTVFRDGKKIGVYTPESLDNRKLIYLMTGESVEIEAPKPVDEHAQTLLKVENLCRKGHYKNISFKLKTGEILGITGRLGSGRTELALSLFGMNPPDSGKIKMNGNELKLRRNRDATRAGIAYVPENRLTQGLIMPQSIRDNLNVSILKYLMNKTGLIDTEKVDENAKRWVDTLSIKVPNLDSAVQTLSGGNQQKVVLSKWLATHPKVLILDEPTVGIDVLAKNSVHAFIKSLAAQGMGIILISDEVYEVLSNSHRVLVMDRGRILDEVLPDSDAEEKLLERFNLA